MDRFGSREAQGRLVRPVQKGQVRNEQCTRRKFDGFVAIVRGSQGRWCFVDRKRLIASPGGGRVQAAGQVKLTLDFISGDNLQVGDAGA